VIDLAPALRQRDPQAMRHVVERCAILHLEHITTSGDPFEKGSSRPLDFGHWSAHRLEILSRHRLQHGEAVAIGVALDCCYAVAIGRLTMDEVEPILGALARIGFALWDDALELRDPQGRRRILEGLEQFREHLGGALTLAMPDGLGRRRDITSFCEATFETAARNLRARRAQLNRLAADPSGTVPR
jgi:3-dehydroquinate synthase